MKVEIWSDYACPFCYIGKRNFENADINSIIAKKYNLTYEEAKANNDKIIVQAKEVGLYYNFDKLITNNTADAHRLAKYAKSLGKEDVIVERLLKAYFVDSLDIGDINTLGDLSCEVGLNKNDVVSMLDGNEYKELVRDEREKASNLGVTGVPFFVFNDKYALSGAQPSESFLEILEKVYAEMA